ncbi:type III secretion system cytoplasmic ring protein SctQ [Roseateles sp. SL47]|uniref:type III secretion system cytoplasmic ring protein SctQ n=1 Tax=Roseateles sp. SL47 TaxID=2995138 RepID=UPI002271454D|nr:type III secretion system cytoplasmic ring protein SctQ [Roseateles sp. SL47]WAC75174.1 type III secretion system cytoplasmic ring protein SctQ [Roseateles sp. SL47]
MSEAQSRLSQQLGGGLIWPLNDLDLPWARAELLLAPASAWRTAEPQRLRLRGRHGVLEFSDGALLTLLTGVQYADDAPVSVIQSLHRLAVARIPLPLMDCLGGPFHVLASDQDHSESEFFESPGLQCLLTLTDVNSECHTFLLQTSLATLNRWSGSPGWQRHALDREAARALPAALRQLSFTGGLHLGQRSMPVQRLRDIGVGDALLLPSKDGAASHPIHILLGSALVKFSQLPDDSYVFEGWVVEAPALSNLSHVKAIEKVSPIMDALKVDLDFIVGRLSMTVAELTALNTGQILPLEVATPPRVRIVAHGTELGSGDLIDVDGRLAVEITHWGSRP